MGIFEIIFIGIGLAMDAFAVSICKGLEIKKLKCKAAIIIAAYFGTFQALMPIIGFYLGTSLESIVVNIDHWIIFILLTIIGGKMINDSFENEKQEIDTGIGLKTMIALAIATSIDALAVGITFAFFNINIFMAVSIIGTLTFIISMIGVKVGNSFGNKFKNKAEIIGGIILILIGLKILLEHLGILSLI